MEADSIYKSYGKKKVLQGISFTAPAGKCTGFIGANGCGKSTLFSILAGVEKADGGTVSLHGKQFGRMETELTRAIGYIPQENALMEDLTVKDNLALYMSLCPGKVENVYIEKLCERFSIQSFEKEKVSRLSGGMKKRVSIVCALLHKPEVLILDEPSTALDLIFKEELAGFIREFTGEGGTVLLSSHDEKEIRQCDKLYAIKDGGAKEIQYESWRDFF